MAAKKKVKLVPTAAPTTKSKNSSTSSTKTPTSKNTSDRSTVEERRAAGRKALWEQTRKEQEERRRGKYGQIEPLAPTLPEQRNLSPTASGKPLNTSYDAQFVPDYFENSDYYKTLIDIPYESMTTSQKGEHLDMFWRFQAGANHMRETGLTDEYPDSDALFGMNDSVNRNISDKYLKDFLSEASEEDIRWLLDDLDAKYADASKYGNSNYSRYVGDGLSTIRDYARSHYSSFANEEINRIGGELAKLNIQMKNASSPYDAELLSEANNALGWMKSNDPISVVASSPRLQEAVGFEELEQQYGNDEMAFADALRQRVAELAETETTRQGMSADAATEYQPKYDALMREMNDAVALRDGLVQTENYNRMMGENWVGSAAGRFNPEDYRPYDTREVLANEYGDTQTQYSYNAPTIAQIAEDPEAVKKAYDQAIAMGADPSKNEDILQVQQMTDEELRLYQALYAVHGEEEAQRFYDHLAPELAGRVTAAYVADKTAFAKEHPFLASAVSIPEKFIGSLAGTADMIAGRDGKNQFSAISQAERETVAQNIAKATPWANVNGTNLVSAAYQGAMSFMDSMFNRALTAGTGSAIAGDVLMGIGSASDAYANAYEATDGNWGKAVITGIASGLIEAGSEHMSWGALSNTGDLGVPGSVWKYIASASATEGLEEVISGLGGSAIESLVLGQGGEIPSRYKYYTQNGYTSTEAIGRIAKELGWETTLEFLIGALMGGTASGVNAAVQMPVINAENRQIGETLSDYGENDSPIMRGFLDLAGTLDLSRSGKKIYEELNGQYARNEALDGKNAQAQANVEQMEKAEAAEELSTENAREELTEGKNAQAQENAAQQTFEETAGTEIESPSDSFDPYGYNAIESVALAAGERGNAVRSMYEEGQDAAKYARQFALAMECGHEALDVNSVLESSMFSELTQEQIAVAYSIGRNGGGNQHLDNNSQFFTERGNALAELYRVQTSKLTDKSMAYRMLDVAAQSAGEKGDIVRDMLLDWQNRERYATQIEKAVQLGREGGDLNAARDSKEFSELTWSQLATAYAIGMESTSQDSDTTLAGENAQVGAEIAEELSAENARQELAEEKAVQADIKAQDRKSAEAAEELDSDSAREELTKEKNAQAQEKAKQQKKANVAKELSTENARAELASGKGKAAVNKAKIGRLYREVMQKLEGNAQKTLRERMSYDVAKELVSAGVDRSEAYNLSMAILRVQDGSATQKDFEAINGNSTARDVLLAYTAKVKAADDAAGKVDELRGLLAGKPPIKKAAPVTSDAPEQESADAEELEPLDGEDAFDAIVAEVQAQEVQESEGETSTLDGEEVQILGIDTKATGNKAADPMLQIKTQDGTVKTVAASSIAYGSNDASTPALAMFASKYGRQGDMMYSAYQPGQNVVEYARAFNKAVQAGSDGRNMDVLKASETVLNDKQLGIAYELGRSQRAARGQEQQMRRSAKGTAVPVGRVYTSSIRTETLKPHQKISIDAMEKLAGALGINVRFVQSYANEQGRYTDDNGSWNADTRTLTLDINAGKLRSSSARNLIMDTAGHELTHYIRQFADSALWDEYQDFVMSHLDTKLNLEHEIKRYMANDNSLSRDDAIEEVIAQASVKALNKITDQQLADLAESNPSLFSKIKKFLDKWIKGLKKAIREAFGSGEGESNHIARAMEDQLDKMAAKWNAMLVNASKNAGASRSVVASKVFADDVKYQGRFTRDEVDDIQSIGRKSVNSFTSDDIKKTENLARRYFKEMGVKSPFFRAWFGDWRAYDTTPVKVAMKEGNARGVVTNGDTGWEIQVSRKVFDETRNHKQTPNIQARPYLNYINDIIESAVLLDSYGIGKAKSENSLLMHSLYAVADLGNGPELLKLYVEEMNDVNKADTGKRAYQLQNIENQRLSVIGSGKSLAKSVSTADAQSVADLVKVVKGTGELKSAKSVNPRLLNADGTPKLMYHGTPYGGFTVFKDWQYFTDNQAYADTYHEPSASSIRGRYYPATDPQTYAVYLSVKKPFDTRDPKIRKIWQDEFYGQYSRTPLSEKGLPDWTDGIDLVEFIEENGYDFDSIILDEGAVGGYGDEVKSRGVSVVVRSSNQIKSATDNIGTFDPESPDIRYQMRDPYEASDRELLATAPESLAENADELDNLRVFQKRIKKLEEKQLQLQDVEDRLHELKQGDAKANRDTVIRLTNNAKTLSDQVNRMNSELMRMDMMAPVKKLAERRRNEYRSKLRERADERVRKAVKEQREIDQRKVDRLKESHGKEKYRVAIMADVKKLYSWVVSPTNKGHVPQFLREPLGKFLESIDFSSASLLKGKDATKNDRKFMDALEKLRYAISDLSKQQSDIEGGANTFAGYIDLPSDYMAEFDELVRKIKTTLEIGDGMTETAFNRMTADQLHEMSKLFRILNSSITKMNRLVANGRYESARTASNDTITDMNAMNAKVKTNKVLSTLNSMFNWKNTTPYYAFQRLGRGGKAIFEGLQDGWDKMARNSAELIAYAKEAFTAKQAKAWSKDIQPIELDSGESVQMTVSQIMSLYCLSKREQAVGHLKGGGIRVSDIDAGKGNTISQVDNYILSEADIARIIGKLTAEQKAVADKLQKFMNTTCSEWGNEISMKRFGYEMFTEKNYFPIETDANNRSRIDDKQDGNNSMFRLLNMSAMKQLTPNANNAIIVRDIFDVFSNHASDIGKYNALALPILDFIKWYNFVERADVVDEHGKPTGQITTRSTQKALERAYGSDAKSYLMSFIKDLNAEHDGGRNDTVLSKLMGTAKAGSVNANMRVGFLQITSLPRAAYSINAKYLLGGMARLKSLNPASAIRGTEAQENIGILKWKSLGFYSTDVARSTRGLVRRDYSAITKVRDLLMKPAEWGDNWVSNIIYEAVKLEMKDKHPALKPGTKAYDAMLNKRVREIVYKTQVVDSTMTRSDFMRSKGLMTAFTAFMSEPTLTVNMLNESIQEAVMNSRAGMSKSENLKSVGGKAVKAAATFAFTALASALVESIFDAMRDDDDYEELEEKFAAAFTGNVVDNVNVLGMLPILKDLVSIAQGYENNSMVTQAATQIMDMKKAIEAVQKGDRPVYSAIYNALKVVASTTGVGVQNATRDGVALYNTFLANAWGTPKIQTYENSKSEAAKAYYAAMKANDNERAEWILERAKVNGLTAEDLSSSFTSAIRNDFNAGSIDANAAEEYLVSIAGKEADAAYWLVREWEYTGDGDFSKYSGLKSAVAAGDRNAAAAAYSELVGHGTNEETVAEQLSKLYNSGEATSLLNLQMRSNQLYTSTLKLKADGQVHKDDFDALITAIVNGNGIADEVRKLRTKGYTTSQCMSAINGAFGKTTDRYGIMQKYNSREAALLLERVLDAYEALGLDRREELAWINENWTIE